MRRVEVRGSIDVMVVRGDEVEFVLEEHPTSGYVWRARAPDPAIVIVDDGLRRDSAVIGGAAQHVFRVRVDAGDSHQIEFELARAWQSAAIERRVVTLRPSP